MAEIKKFISEKDLIKEIFPVVRGEIKYVGVSKLAQKNITPDIDILIMTYQSEIVGYEIKILGSDKGGNVSKTEFYKGIGEALMYLRYGIEKVGLICGFKNSLNNEKIENFIQELKNEKDLLKRILGKYFSLGIYTSYIEWIFYAQSNFYSGEKNFLMKIMKEKRLSYNKKFLKEINLCIK